MEHIMDLMGNQLECTLNRAQMWIKHLYRNKIVDLKVFISCFRLFVDFSTIARKILDSRHLELSHQHSMSSFSTIPSHQVWLYRSTARPVSRDKWPPRVVFVVSFRTKRNRLQVLVESVKVTGKFHEGKSKKTNVKMQSNGRFYK